MPSSEPLMQAMAVMAAALPGDVDEATARLWRSEFGKLPAPVIEQAARIAYRTLKFFPSVSDFTQIVMRVLGGELMSADEAWSEVERLRSATPGSRRELACDEVWAVIDEMRHAPLDRYADDRQVAATRRTFTALWNQKRQRALDAALGGEVVSRPNMLAPAAGAAKQIQNKE